MQKRAHSSTGKPVETQQAASLQSDEVCQRPIRNSATSPAPGWRSRFALLDNVND